MKVLAFLLINFSCFRFLSLAKDGNNNEGEQTLPKQEWLNPFDMTHYDAAAQSLDETVSTSLLPRQTTS